MTDRLTVIRCGPSTAECECRCAEGGECEHRLDAAWQPFTDDSGTTGGTVICTRCGMSAVSHSLWVAP